MATATDACANIQTETERETTKTKFTKVKETGAEKSADIEVIESETSEVEKQSKGKDITKQVEEIEEEEDIEVLYDSLELPQIPAIKTSAVPALEQKLTKTIAHIEVRVDVIANGDEKVEDTAQEDVVDSSCKADDDEEEEEQYIERVEMSMVDDIPEPIKVLDDIISEFEASSEVKPAIGSVENQSEDDGYMSLSRKK